MKELLELAKKFLEENPGINEVELTNAFGDRIHLVRHTPPPNTFTPHWTPTPNQY